MRVFIITYDISDPKRLRSVYHCMNKWGKHMQYSVYRCRLDRSGLLRLRNELLELIHSTEDQILFIDLGLENGRGSEAIQAIGKPYTQPERRAIII